MSGTDHDAFLDALADGEGYYLACPNGHGNVPPRRVCPECESTTLTEEPLPATGELVTYSEVEVSAPQFEEDTPYVTAIAEFGPVALTGQVRGVDADAVEVGLAVEATVERTATDDSRVVVFRPA